MSVKSKLDIKNKPKQKNVKVDVQTYEQLKYMSNTLNLKQNRFLSDLINELFNICGTFQKANVSYMQSVTGSYVMVQFSGRNRLIFGTESDLLKDKEINKKTAIGR